MKLVETEKYREYTYFDGTVLRFEGVDFVDANDRRHKIHHRLGWSYVYNLECLRLLDISVKELTF